MTKSLDIAAVFKNDAADLRIARDRAHEAHPNDIRAAGNEVEIAVREYLRRLLPRKYYVSHGHLIDRELNVSPQLDVIIADSEYLPTLMRMKDGTEYVPAEATYAIGEIKSTFSHSARHLETYCGQLRSIATELKRPEVPNTAYGGTITGDTLMSDVLGNLAVDVYNRLLSFMLCVDAGDFTLERARVEMQAFDRSHTPGVVALLDRGVLVPARIGDRFEYNAYPGTGSLPDAPHVLATPEALPSGSLEGGVLGLLFHALVGHLTRSRLEPTLAEAYLAPLLRFRRGAIEGL